MTADTDPAEAALWALTFIEAIDSQDLTGQAALLADVPKEIVAERLGGIAIGLVIELCTVTELSPGEWLAHARTQHNGMSAA